MLLTAPLVAVITAALHKQANERATAMQEPGIKRSREFPIGWSLGIVGTVIAILIGGLLVLTGATAL